MVIYVGDISWIVITIILLTVHFEDIVFFSVKQCWSLMTVKITSSPADARVYLRMRLTLAVTSWEKPSEDKHFV